MRGTILSLIALCAVAAACGDRSEPTAARAELAPQARLDRSANADDHASNAIFRFERLRGNAGPLVGAAGEIRGIPAGGLPWHVDRGEARLDANGELRAEVEGLVLDPADPRVPPAVAGTNPVPAFQAVLSCETFVGAARQVVNVKTDPVPTDEQGNAEIRQRLHGIPSPCYAPIVFITSPSSATAPFGSWFAVSGF
jgi:hypothetical protein